MMRCILPLFFLILFVIPTKINAQGKPLITTTFYTWFTSPHNSPQELNSPDSWVYTPPVLDGSNDELYWERNLKDLVYAGIDGAFLITRRNDNLMYVKKANDSANSINSPVKFGLFIDHIDADYKQDVEPFYRLIPNSRWLKYEGRPIIMIWTLKTGSSTLDHTMQSIRDSFTTDFGITPFLILESETYQKLVNKQLVDSAYAWNSPIGGIVNLNINNFEISSVGIGNNEQFIRPWRCTGDNPNDPVINYKSRGDTTDPAQFIKTNFSKMPTDIDLIFIQDANELNEGTTFLRASNFPATDNPVFNYCAQGYSFAKHVQDASLLQKVRDDYHNLDNKRYLKEDFYISTLRKLVLSKFPQKGIQLADISYNGKIDIFDYNILVSKFGNPYTIFDYNILVANFGKSI